MRRSLRKCFCVFLTVILFYGMDIHVNAIDLNYYVTQPHVIINQIYGSGDGGYVSHSFIEIYNPTDSDVDITGWTLQYRSSKSDKDNSDRWYKFVFPDNTVIPCSTSLLVRCNHDEKNESQYRLDLSNETSYDFSWNQVINTKGCAVVLCSSDVTISTDDKVFDNIYHKPTIESFVDLLAMSGNDAASKPKQIIEWYEGQASPLQSKKKGIRRWNCTDTDVNAADTVMVDYSSNEIDLEAVRPRCLNDGKWTPGEQINRSIMFSKESGFYDDAFLLTIETDADAEIYYTLDGTIPIPGSDNTIRYLDGIDISDATGTDNRLSTITDIGFNFVTQEDREQINAYSTREYRKPLYNIDKCTVIRAIAFFKDGTESNVETKSYFVGLNSRDTVSGMQVLSLCIDPADLFDEEKGIYIKGLSNNYGQRGREWEREATAAFFDKTGKEVLSQNIGIRIHGGYSRNYSQKSFNLYAREEYDGKKRFQYDFFSTGYKAKTLTLSGGGTDTISKSADYLVNTACINDDRCAIAHMIPYSLFINGEYWGMYYLTEKYDDKYVQHYYGVDDDNVVIIKNGSIEEGNSEDYQLWKEMRKYVVNNDMENDENFSRVTEMIDVDSFAQYYAIMAYIDNFDCLVNNYALWRTREIDETSPYGDCRWRWMVFDVNSIANMRDYKRNIFDQFISQDKTFRSLMYNKGFREKLAAAISYVGHNYFDLTEMNTLIDEYETCYLKSLEASFDRYYDKETNSQIKETLVNRKAFFSNRYNYIMGYMNTFLNNPGLWLKDTITHVNAIAADCTHDGQIEYWRNERTKRLFSDAECRNEISREDLIVHKKGHFPNEIIKENEKTPTCNENGYYDEVVYCGTCGVKLSSKHVSTKAPGHQPGDTIKENASDATAKEPGGYDEVVYCKECNEELNRKHYTISSTGKPIEEIKATCLHTGIMAHYLDTATGKTYLDSDYTIEITSEELVIPATGQYVEKVPATCIMNGKKEYYLDTATGICYADPKYMTEISEEDLLLLATGETVAEISATCTNEGIKAHYLDGATGKLYSDPAYTIEVSLDDLVIPATGHFYTEQRFERTSDEPGFNQYTCIYCGHSYNVVDSYESDSTAHMTDGKIVNTINHEYAKYAYSKDKTVTFIASVKANISAKFDAVRETDVYIPNAKHRYVVSNKRIATISSRGTLTPQRSGEIDVFLEQKVKGGKWTSISSIHVYIQKPVMKKKDTQKLSNLLDKKLNAYEYLSHTTYSPTNWKSSNRSIATIDDDGIITIKKKGTVKIIAEYRNGSNKKYYTTVLKIK